MTREKMLRKIANSPRLLRRRLNQAKAVLRREYHEGFGEGIFDHDRKTLTGNNGLVLHWQPDPETSVGSVYAYIREGSNDVR